jgi:anti-anti-sigma factor
VQGFYNLVYTESIISEGVLVEANYVLCGEVLVVELKGRLNHEMSGTFRKTCLERLLTERVVFDLRHLNFVGSLGLKDFVDTLDHMAQKTQLGVRFCGLSSEFRRLFDASGIPSLNIFENSDKAVQSFAAPIPQVSLL